jgi:CHAD domain-containing protein
MRRVLQGVRGGAALAPIAIVRVERGLHRVHDAEGRPLAEIAVDEVHATELGEFAVGRHWREVEVELLDGDEALLERCARRLGKSGAHPAASPSKLRRALGDPGADATPEGVAELLQGYLDTQYAVILAGDLALRQGPAAVHGIRTAVRRYRSVLRELEPVLDAERAVHLEGELRWWALALGEVRDREVLRSHLAAAVAQLPGELVLGPVAARIEETVSTEERDARAALDRLMRTKRYFALLAELAAWHEQVPADERVPADVVARYVAKATHRTRRRLKRARRGQGTPEHDAQLHSARKAAKRARYLAELARPELGKKAHKAGRKMKRVQRRLGRHQDHVIAAQFLRRVGAVAGTAPNENGFTFGLLFESESAAARIAR